MKLLSLEDQVDRLVEHLKKREKFSDSELNIVSSPYRISPLGAHIDHQGGPVLGMTINARTLLAFVPNNERKIRLYSMNYPGVVEFSLDNIKTPRKDDWGRYAMGAAKIIQNHIKLKVGFTGVVHGTLPASGLSSSASIGMAYLKALSFVNNFDFTSEQYVSLDLEIEYKFLKLQCGILDQCSIVYGQKNSMLYIDTLSGKVTKHPWPSFEEKHKILIFYSGLTRELTYSDFNTRVAECKRTAGLLGIMGGLKSPQILSDIPAEVYEKQKERLPEDIKPWAKHYFSEVERVEEGIHAWDSGSLEDFGKLMNESSISTLENYQGNSQEICKLFELIISYEGVYGASINGGGYGGSVVAFVSKDFSDNSGYEIISKYNLSFPALKEKSLLFLAEPDDELKLA